MRDCVRQERSLFADGLNVFLAEQQFGPTPRLPETEAIAVIVADASG